MAVERVRLRSLEISNYLGAGEQPIVLEFNGEDAAFCGPNGSGKTTVLSALEGLKRSLSPFNPGGPFLQACGGLTDGRYNVGVWEWVDARPRLTDEVFHGRAETFQVAAKIDVPLDILEKELRFPDLPDPVPVRFAIYARRDQKIRLESVWLDSTEAFRNGASAGHFSVTGGNAPGATNYLTHFAQPTIISFFNLPIFLLRRVISFPSRRQATLGSDTDLGGLAGGGGLVSWVEAATNPNPKDADSAGRHTLLQEFQEEFAEFIGRRSVSLSVPKYSLPMRNNEQPEVNVTIDGRLRLLSQVGAGIGEALIVLLVSKLSQEWRDPPVDILLLEEPELHIHSTLQRKLLDRLAAYGVQIVAGTHSPTVVNWFARNGGRVFRTEFIEAQERITVRQATGLKDLRELVGSIGASPGDVALADKVLLVEGANDVPVFKAWLAKAPANHGQNIPVLSLGGNDAASSNFDAEQWRSLHPKIFAILDSERKAPGKEPAKEKQEIKAKLEAVGIGCHLTDRRSTEAYFTSHGLQVVYGDCPETLDSFGDPNLKNQGVRQFAKFRNGEVAQAMEWEEIEKTDLGIQIEEFLGTG